MSCCFQGLWACMGCCSKKGGTTPTCGHRADTAQLKHAKLSNGRPDDGGVTALFPGVGSTSYLKHADAVAMTMKTPSDFAQGNIHKGTDLGYIRLNPNFRPNEPFAGDNGVVAAENLNRAAGHVNGLTLPGGLYKWTTSVTITESLTFDAAHNSSTVWILQIDGSLSLGASALVTLTNGAQPMNIFWQVAGTTNILADAHAEGIILCATAIIFGSGASLTGRALAQTEVTMIATTVTEAEEEKEEL